jgi:hypothetical protein
MKPVYVVPCSATKADTLAELDMPALDAYVGQAFTTLVRQLQQAGAQWVILSARYGFVSPESVIVDYDAKVGECQAVGLDGAFDALSTKDFLALACSEEVVVLGSRAYAEEAGRLLDRPVVAPFAGLQIGQLLQAASAGDWLRDF